MAITKASFMSRPKIRALPAAEKERRWKQHLMSEGGRMDLRAGGRTVRGKGNYFMKALRAVDNNVLKRLPKGTFGAAGEAIGSRFGAGGLGRAAGELMSQITGRGNYTIQHNSIVSGDAMKPNQLSFSPSGAASVRIRKREYIGKVTAPEEPFPFHSQRFRLQCTDGITFPWLSDIAGHFTEWQLCGCVLTFETSSSNFSQNMALGTVAIGTQYNSNEPEFRDLEDILQSPYHTRGNPSESLLHGIECDPTLQVSEKLFTRRPGCAGPPNLYDHGVVTVATEGLPTTSAGSIIGRLFITYDIELNLPILPSRHITSGGSVSFGIGAASYNPLGPVLSCHKFSGDLTFGSDVGSQVLQLTTKDGPHVNPHNATGSTVMWMNDHPTTYESYMTFQLAGTYQLYMMMYNVGGQHPSQLTTMTVVPYDSSTVVDSQFLSSNDLSGGGLAVAIFVYTITTKKDEGTIVLKRLDTSNQYVATTSLTIC